VEDVATRDLGLGVHSVDLQTQALAEGSQLDSTFHWPDADRWEGENFAVRVAADGGSP
jgi:glucoamylase